MFHCITKEEKEAITGGRAVGKPYHAHLSEWHAWHKAGNTTAGLRLSSGLDQQVLGGGQTGAAHPTPGPKGSPDVRGLAVHVRQLQQVLGAALLVGEGPPDLGLQHVLRDLVPGGHAAQVLRAAPLVWVLQQVRLHQVVEDVVFTDALDRTAAGGAQGRALHPARVAGSAEGVHTGLQAKGTRRAVEAWGHSWAKRLPSKYSSPSDARAPGARLAWGVRSKAPGSCCLFPRRRKWSCSD